jgi:myo-inositol-1(or 4)-monophosphatase
MDASPDQLADVAESVARAAGALLLEGAGRVRVVVETKSTRTDMVTEMDRASEALVVQMLAEARPGDAVLGEEGTASAGTTGVRWVVDPLDGTTNYLYGFPAWAVSVAAEVDGHPVAGAVFDPVHDELFRAVKGGGSTCNGVPLHVEGAPDLATALVGTGFSYDAARRAVQARELVGILPVVRDVRRAGSAALDLCSLARGRLDAYYERGLARWDWAAAALVASEAGALVEHLEDGTTVAAPPQLFAPLLALLDAARLDPA